MSKDVFEQKYEVLKYEKYSAESVEPSVGNEQKNLEYKQNHTTDYTKLLYQAFTELKVLTDILDVCLIKVIQPIDPHAKDNRMAKSLQD